MRRLNDVQINNFLAKIMIRNELINKTKKTEDDFEGDYRVVFREMLYLNGIGENIGPVEISDRMGSMWLYELCEIHHSYVKYLRHADGFYDECCLFCGFNKTCEWCNQ